MLEVDELLRRARRICDDVEIYWEVERRLTAKAVLDRIEVVREIEHSGYGIRVINRGRLGFAYFNDAEKVEWAVKQALKGARYSIKGDFAFAPPARYPRVKRLYDKHLAEFDAADAVDGLCQMADVSSKARHVESVIKRSIGSWGVVNTQGLEVVQRAALLEAASIFQCGDGRAHDFYTSRECFDFAEVAQRAAQYAVPLARRRKVRGEYDVIFDPIAFDQLLHQILIPAVNGEMVMKCKSPLVGRLGQSIATEQLTLCDNPLVPGGTASCRSDDEGIPQRPRPIIERGVLTGYLYDMRTAQLCGLSSTGNGFRSSFSVPPRIGTTNLVVEPGQMDEKDVRGLMVRDLLAVHNVNTETGDFAVEIAGGYVWHGEIVRGIERSAVVGNFYDMLYRAQPCCECHRSGDYIGPAIVFRTKVV